MTLATKKKTLKMTMTTKKRKQEMTLTTRKKEGGKKLEMTLTTRGPPLSPWQESFPPAPPWRIISGNSTKNSARIIDRLLVDTRPSILSVLLADC